MNVRFGFEYVIVWCPADGGYQRGVRVQDPDYPFGRVPVSAARLAGSVAELRHDDEACVETHCGWGPFRKSEGKR